MVYNYKEGLQKHCNAVYKHQEYAILHKLQVPHTKYHALSCWWLKDVVLGHVFDVEKST